VTNSQGTTVSITHGSIGLGSATNETSGRAHRG
jgi:hypothetical protein